MADDEVGATDQAASSPRSSPPITRVDVRGGFDPSPHGFSSAVVVPPGSALAFVSGQLADDLGGAFEQQVAEAFANLGLALRAAGASERTVVKITCLVVEVDSQRLATVSAARRSFFGPHRPASTIQPVPRLAAPRALFEVDAVAVVA